MDAEEGFGQSICAVSATVNCDAVVLSAYGSLAGTPLSAFGAWFYPRKALDENINAALADGVSGTPALFVNGRRHAGQLSSTDLVCLARGTLQSGEGVSRWTNP